MIKGVKERMEVLMSVENDKKVCKLVESIVKSLSKKYGFSVEEGMRYLEVDKKEYKSKNEIIPWCGVINEYNCQAIRYNHGLYTQCNNKKESKLLCKTCNNQSLKRENKEPPYGLIKERLLKGKDYVDVKGKRPVQYGNVMLNENITRERAEKYAASQGLKISEEDFEVKKVNRGRPKKCKSEIDEEVDKRKKGRGRPRKNKEEEKVEEEEVEEEKVEEKEVEEEEVEEEEVEEEEVEVKEFIFNKKLYYRNPVNNALYDPKSYEHIGRWDEENEKILDMNEDEDEE